MIGTRPSPPRKVFLFSGHMVDSPLRPTSRFPERAVPVAGRAIADTLDRLGAGPQDLGICGGACGGDLLFAEGALQRGAWLEIFLPFEVATFLPTSVDFAGPAWRARFEAVTSRCILNLPPPEPRQPGKPRQPPADDDPYEANNRRMLQAAQASGAAGIEFICLWDGEGGDGPGGTAHMVREVQRLGGQVHWLKTTALWS